MQARHPFLDHPGPLAIAHRGGGLEGEENTLPAFAHAVALGYSHVELDVHATSDGEVVIHHDPTLDRMTGEPRAIADMTFAELRRVRTRGGAGIPRLADLLEEWPDLFVNIEPKDDRVIEPLATLLRATGALGRIGTGSFSAARTRRLAGLVGPDLCRSPAWAGVLNVRLAGLGVPVPRPDAQMLQVPERFRGVAVVVPGFVRAARRMGLPVQVWTVNDEADMVRLLDMGVDAIMTDRPTLLREVLRKRGAGVLEGLRIVEFEGLGPGPFAAMWFADQGAEVISIQRPGGAALPGLPEANLLDRGKRTIALDLKSPADLAVVRALVARADGVIEGNRPGVMERLGLGPADLQALNPRLVYGRMTGWGQEGPRALQAGHDLQYIALSGAAWYASPPGQPPFTPPTLVGDIGGGAMYLVAGMLAALWRAQAGGRGAVVDAAIVDGSAHMMALLMAIQAGGMFRAERGRSLLDGPYWSRSYACADGFVAVQCLEPKFHAEFLARLGLSDDPRFARQNDPAGWPAAAQALAAIFAAHPRAHWAAVFEGSDACLAPVLSPEEAARDPHLAARGTWVTAGDLQPAAAPRYMGEPFAPPPAPPRRDADRAAILAELGLSG